MSQSEDLYYMLLRAPTTKRGVSSAAADVYKIQKQKPLEHLKNTIIH